MVINGEGEGLAGSCHWTGSDEGQMPRLRPRDWRSRVTDRGWLTPGPGSSRSARVHGKWTVLTKSRWRLGKSSGGAGGLDGQAIKDDGDTCRAVWWFGPQNHRGGQFPGLGQNPGAVLAGIGGGMCRHREAKLSYEGRVAIGSTDL
jgi:hypothetical protein